MGAKMGTGSPVHWVADHRGGQEITELALSCVEVGHGTLSFNGPSITLDWTISLSPQNKQDAQRHVTADKQLASRWSSKPILTPGLGDRRYPHFTENETARRSLLLRMLLHSLLQSRGSLSSSSIQTHWLDSPA